MPRLIFTEAHKVLPSARKFCIPSKCVSISKWKNHKNVRNKKDLKIYIVNQKAKYTFMRKKEKKN